MFFFFFLTVKEKLTADPESEIATTSLRVSLLCPVNIPPYCLIKKLVENSNYKAIFFFTCQDLYFIMQRQKVLLHILYIVLEYACFILQYFVILKINAAFNAVQRGDIYFCLFCVEAGQDEADNPMQSDNMLSPSVLRCYTLYPNE